MCWFSENSEKPKQLIADKNITVYKVILSGLYSQIKKFKYERNKLYRQAELLRLEYSEFYSKYFIMEGYHSYSSFNKACVNCYSTDILSLSSDIIKQFHRMFIYDCIIPKGSVYYHNLENHEIVSNQIIIKEKHKFN